jgi:hypothetical protein
MGYLRVFKRKRNSRRLLAAGFFLVMFVEIGSHAILAGPPPQSGRASTWCEVMHHVSPSADCPHKRHPRAPQSSVFDGIAHHWALLGDITLPVKGVLFNAPAIGSSIVAPLSRAITPPFHPPKQL